MTDIRNHLSSLLENPKLHKELAEAFYTGLKSPAEFQSLDLRDHMRRARRMKLRRVLRNVMQRMVIDELPVPLPVTAEDLALIAITHLVGVPLGESSESEEVARAYQRFISFVLREVDSKRPYIRPFDLGLYSIPRVDLDYYYPGFQLWSSPTGFTLYGDSAGDAIETKVFGLLMGYSSHRALKRLHSAFEEVIVSIVETVRLCVTSGDCDGGADDHISPPPISFLEKDGGRVISTCLTASCQRPATGKDELLERLRNAIVLLSHADRIAFDPLALSLSFAAIEALVCEEGIEPTRQIRMHVPTLLVQEAEKRKARERVMGRLYTIRCDVLHGRKVHGSSDASEAVRRIAAGVIRAVACWREHHLRVPGPPTWKELMDELNAASRKPGIVVGVPDLSELIPDKVPS